MPKTGPRWEGAWSGLTQEEGSLSLFRQLYPNAMNWVLIKNRKLSSQCWRLGSPRPRCQHGLLTSCTSHGGEQREGVCWPREGCGPSGPHLISVTSQRTHLLRPSHWGESFSILIGGEERKGHKYLVHNQNLRHPFPYFNTEKLVKCILCILFYSKKNIQHPSDFI